MRKREPKMIDARKYFRNSDFLDGLVLRPLSHIKGNWEVTWDGGKQEYEPEEESYAESLNHLIDELSRVSPPTRYHDNEDRLAEYVITKLNWNIKKVGGRWTGVDYAAILEHGGFDDINQENLILASAGRIKAAIDRHQLHFDDMEPSHQKMLAAVLAIILFHRT